MARRELVFFTVSSQSGMGRFAAELADAAARIDGCKVIFIAPRMEREPMLCHRVILPCVTKSSRRFVKLVSLAAMSVVGVFHVLRHVRHRSTFVMIELGSTVPISVLPVFAARLRGAVTVLNLHDFYPHVFRFGQRLRRIEKAAYRWCFRRFDFIAAMKQAQVARLQEEAGVAAHRVFLIEHGPFEIAGVQPSGSNASALRLLVLGSIRRNKKTLEVAKSVAQLQQEGLQITLRVAGQPRHQEAEYWALCAEQLSLSQGNEVIARYIEDHEMPAVLSNIDAIICPYEGFDSQSGVSIVAASNAIPLIATSAAGVLEGQSAAYSIAEPVTVETVGAAIKDFMTQSHSDRRSRAMHVRRDFLAKGIWEASAKTILAKTARAPFSGSQAARGASGSDLGASKNADQTGSRSQSSIHQEGQK